MTRREFSNRTRLQAWERSGGKCEECGLKLHVGDRREYDHRIPDGLGGKNDLDNCVVLCGPCHSAKTRTEDVPNIARAKRVKAKQEGAWKSRNPLPGSRDGKWKQKIGGTWVLRNGE